MGVLSVVLVCGWWRKEGGRRKGGSNWCSWALKNGGTGQVEMARTIFRWGTRDKKHKSQTSRPILCELEKAQDGMWWAGCRNSDWIHRLVLISEGPGWAILHKTWASYFHVSITSPSWSPLSHSLSIHDINHLI